MTKTELITAVAQHAGLDRKTVAAALDALTATITATVARGEDVTVIGFGRFEQVHKPARTGRNPQTGAPVEIPARDVPRFVPGSAFKEAVASGRAAA